MSSVLRPAIDRVAAGEFDDSPAQRQMMTLLARIVGAEMDFRARRSPAKTYEKFGSRAATWPAPTSVRPIFAKPT